MTQASGQKRAGRHSWPRVTQRGEFLVEERGGCATWASQGPSESRLGSLDFVGSRGAKKAWEQVEEHDHQARDHRVGPSEYGGSTLTTSSRVQERTQVRYFSLLGISHTMEKTMFGPK